MAPEASPFVKVGGLGEVMYSLPKALREIGHDTRVMIPKYSSIDSAKFSMTMAKEGLLVPKGDVSAAPENDQMICNVKKFLDPDNGHAVTYLLENEEYYEQRGSVYGYDVDPTRWALLSRGALEFVRTNDEWRPDVIVASDWQGGLIPNYIKTVYKDDPILSKIATAFSIHNLYFQGMFDHRFTSEMDYDDGQSGIPPIGDPRMSKVNFMRRGIRYADVINTVSPNYAREITTPEYGELLENLLQWSRMRQTSYPFNPTVKNLSTLIEDNMAILLQTAGSKDIKLQYSVPENIDVFVDINMFQTIVRNLVSNAIKFTGTGQEVALIAQKLNENEATISVRDTGIGMPKEVLENLFMLNTISNRPGTEGEPSSGLGLIICKEFVEKHGGTLWAESEEGKGSLFSFTIPIHDTQKNKKK
ncbi:MAG: glycogen/starch synthase, ADP-glucose type [Parcubacteria group bacterium GW2011_GWB2_40_8]|nr:MAG: glycogen/starch synthase, ADP-glucose type [Parcubacteria group bacterium GW2011_GWB2_40_8]